MKCLKIVELKYGHPTFELLVQTHITFSFPVKYDKDMIQYDINLF